MRSHDYTGARENGALANVGDLSTIAPKST
jgi:hypothetical protein